MRESRILNLPRIGGSIAAIETNNSLLFIGANGSGKTRLGTWIEIQSEQRKHVHRISAQKSLSMPESITPTAYDQAERSLLYGNPTWSFDHKSNKWGGKPATTLLSDYEKLMVFLFSDQIEVNAQFMSHYKERNVRLEPPVTKLDLVKELWERILPHRELVIGGLRIQTRVRDESGATYNSSEMSDGERVIFYLIAQCLAAPVDGIIVIDEPELHLHKAVQIPLWTEVEKLRKDCLFIYLTHDVDFAASRENATRIWLKNFDGSAWDWEVIRPDGGLPDELLFEVLGSRKPVVFVEGKNGSYDVSLYRELFPEFLIIPRGSCSEVIISVKALQANSQLHHLSVSGIVDRDRRVPAEISALEKDSIFVLSVAEVENLFCTRELIQIVSEKLHRNADQDFLAVSTKIFENLQAELENQVILHVMSELKFQMSKFNSDSKDIENLEHVWKSQMQGIDIRNIYRSIHDEFSRVIQDRDYEGLLSIYNRKSLAAQVSGLLGLKNGELPNLVLRLSRGEFRHEVRRALKKYFGNFSSRID